jgi:hypothetical protein
MLFVRELLVAVASPKRNAGRSGRSDEGVFNPPSRLAAVEHHRRAGHEPIAFDEELTIAAENAG